MFLKRHIALNSAIVDDFRIWKLKRIFQTIKRGARSECKLRQMEVRLERPETNGECRCHNFTGFG